MKVALFAGSHGCVFRRIAKYDREYPEASHLITRPDYFGIDSAYDYDPVWAAARELKIAVTFHTGMTGWASAVTIRSASALV